MKRSTRLPPIPPAARDRRMAAALAAWFRRAARPLPWRTNPDRAAPRDPYRSLVSEFMLQQTQVSRVIDKYEPFLKEFPSAAALAAADESEVLAAWSGLGYYRRARLLHACAKAIVSRHAGRVPSDAIALKDLPGIGRYTAGSIASIVFNAREPIVDGNVCRVLQRLDARRGHAADKSITDWAWRRADAFVRLSTDPALFNEGLMELGATVCTPAAPRCTTCPLRSDCRARARGSQNAIPSPKPPASRQSVFHHSVVIRARAGRVLIEQRPRAGLWASMWQPPTLENASGAHTPFPALLARLRLPRLRPSAPALKTLVKTSHRDVHFTVWHALVDRVFLEEHPRRWVTRRQLDRLAVSNAHRALLLQAFP